MADGLTNETIQRRIDEAAKRGGGTLNIAAGVYAMNDALHLRSGVRVVGEKGVVLRKVPSVSSKIVDYLGYGHHEFTVAEPEKFRAGMGVHIRDQNSSGFYTTVASIVEKRGELLFINRMLNHDYGPGANAVAVSAYSIVEGANVENASIENVTLDGNPEETFTLNGCRGGGVFLIGTRGVAIRNVEIANWHGDAISFQQCIDTRVEGCHLHHNTNGGMHPGSGSVRYVMADNHVHDNGGCGVFYCLRTMFSRCVNNRIHDNGHGISIGERDSDHLIQGNDIRNNGAPGIDFREPTRRAGDRVKIVENTIGPNCTKEGRAEIDIHGAIHDVWIAGNTISPREGKPALCVDPASERIHFAQNRVSGREQKRGDVSGEVARVSLDAPNEFPAVGPEACPSQDALHLGLAKLDAWRGE